jgi:GT2 family glycosyltransferase
LTQTVPFKQIIVVDNHSTDGSSGIINSFTGIQKICLESNIGYSGAANAGIRACRSDIVMVANSDIILDPQFNRLVLAFFDTRRDVSIVSPLLLRFDRKTVDSAGQEISRALYPREIGFNRQLDSLDLHEREVFSVCGAATLFRKSALDILKIKNEFYDEDFFMFWEDFDIGWRAQLLGLKVMFFPGAVVYHYRSGTLKKNFFSRFSLSLARSPVIKYHLIKNRYLTLIKNFRLSRFPFGIFFAFAKDLLWVSLLTISAPKIIIKLLKSRKYFKSAGEKRKIIMKKRG